MSVRAREKRALGYTRRGTKHPLLIRALHGMRPSRPPQTEFVLAPVSQRRTTPLCRWVYKRAGDTKIWRKKYLYILTKYNIIVQQPWNRTTTEQNAHCLMPTQRRNLILLVPPSVGILNTLLSYIRNTVNANNISPALLVVLAKRFPLWHLYGEVGAFISGTVKRYQSSCMCWTGMIYSLVIIRFDDAQISNVRITLFRTEIEVVKNDSRHTQDAHHPQTSKRPSDTQHLPLPVEQLVQLYSLQGAYKRCMSTVGIWKPRRVTTRNTGRMIKDGAVKF